MTDAGWWARKLGRVPDVAPPSPTNYPPPGYAPQGYQQPYQPPQPSGPPPAWIEDESVPGGKRLNWRAWAKGGQGNREETMTCPQCGGSNFFSRRQNAIITKNGTAWPAPQCANCSYNGVFTIFGG